MSTNLVLPYEDRLASFRLDPLGFALWGFPWGEGRLKDRFLYDWQIEFLKTLGEQLQGNAELDISEVIQKARRSGHGIGKSALVAILILWAMSTLVDTRGVVTANTEAQLKGKTWPELAKWHAMCVCGDLFTYQATSLYSSDPAHEKNWRIDLVPWSVNNTEAFAGLHNEGRRLILIFDEASAIPNKIWEVAEGALTDESTEIIWCAFGNPTRNAGRFHDCFNRLAHRWDTASIDSRTVPGVNKAQIQRWLEDYGEDSDFFRVRVKGQAPRASYNQLIGIELVHEARDRQMHYQSPRTACVGVDCARFGDDDSVIATRLGRDARTFPPIRVHGADTSTLVAAIGNHVNYLSSLSLRVVLFVDGGYVGGAVVDILRDLGYEVIEVLFGASADAPTKYANKRAEMYGRMRTWLRVGYLHEDCEQFEREATAVLYTMPKDVLQLERKDIMKDREGFSPDEADALACTFAYPVPELPTPGSTPLPVPSARGSEARRAYNPYARG